MLKLTLTKRFRTSSTVHLKFLILLKNLLTLSAMTQTSLRLLLTKLALKLPHALTRTQWKLQLVKQQTANYRLTSPLRRQPVSPLTVKKLATALLQLVQKLRPVLPVTRQFKLTLTKKSATGKRLSQLKHRLALTPMPPYKVTSTQKLVHVNQLLAPKLLPVLTATQASKAKLIA